jgi:hypothetical protein
MGAGARERTSGTVRLTLDVERGSEPISGRLRGQGAPESFHGWLVLAAALEAARARPLDATAADGPVGRIGG